MLTRRSRTAGPGGTFRDVTPSRPPSVSVPVQLVRHDGEVEHGAASARVARLDHERAEEPARDLLEDASWLWYQNVPAWSARKRYV